MGKNLFKQEGCIHSQIRGFPEHNFVCFTSASLHCQNVIDPIATLTFVHVYIQCLTIKSFCESFFFIILYFTTNIYICMHDTAQSYHIHIHNDSVARLILRSVTWKRKWWWWVNPSHREKSSAVGNVCHAWRKVSSLEDLLTKKNFPPISKWRRSRVWVSNARRFVFEILSFLHATIPNSAV